MPRLDLYRLSGAYLLDVQTFDKERLASRVVVPLILLSDLTPIRRLNPIFTIEGESYVMATQGIAAVSTAELGPVIGALPSSVDHEVTSALDYLLSWS